MRCTDQIILKYWILLSTIILVVEPLQLLSLPNITLALPVENLTNSLGNLLGGTKKPSVTKSPLILMDSPKICELSITISNGQQKCKGDLIFNEEFNNPGLSNWKIHKEIPLDTEDAEFVSYQKDACQIENGNFVVKPKLLTDIAPFTEDSLFDGVLSLDGCTGSSQQCTRMAGQLNILPPIVSCKISSSEKFSFKYGKVEIRAKFPKGDWLFPQLFLDPADVVNTGYGYGQMRIGFIRGNEQLKTQDNLDISGSHLYGGVILAAGELHRDAWLYKYVGNNHFGNDFHTYGLTWTKESIVLSVDGNIYATINGGFREYSLKNNLLSSSVIWNNENIMSPFDREFYITLGVGVGGISDFPDRSKNGPTNLFKPWLNRDPKNQLNFWLSNDEWYKTWTDGKLTVDYVKVWAV